VTEFHVLDDRHKIFGKPAASFEKLPPHRHRMARHVIRIRTLCFCIVDEDGLEGAEETVVEGHHGVSAAYDRAAVLSDRPVNTGKGVFLHDAVGVDEKEDLAVAVVRAGESSEEKSSTTTTSKLSWDEANSASRHFPIVRRPL
jgi:hypothetical protein